MKNKLDLVTICIVQGELNAELIKSRLEAEGIPAMLKFETYFSLQVGAFCPVSVLVPSQYAEVAYEIIKPPDKNLIKTIPVKNKWTFALLRLFSWFVGGSG